MGRLIDVDETMKNLSKANMSRTGDEFERFILRQPSVEAIPKAEVKKFLEEGTKDVSNKVLAIVREDYIHKSVYEARLKADMVAMLEELDFRLSNYQDTDLLRQDIQQKINALKGEKDE